MDAIGVERANVLGWSMGGFVAQRLAVDHPERVRHLVLAGTNPGGRQAVLGTRAAQRIDSDPDPSDAEILHELYPPDDQAEGRRFLRRLVTASQSGEIPDDFHVPARDHRRAGRRRGPVAAQRPQLPRAGRRRRRPRWPRRGARTRWCRRSTCSGSRLGSPAPSCGCSRERTRFLFSDRDAFTRAVEELVGR